MDPDAPEVIHGELEWETVAAGGLVECPLAEETARDRVKDLDLITITRPGDDVSRGSPVGVLAFHSRIPLDRRGH